MNNAGTRYSRNNDDGTQRRRKEWRRDGGDLEYGYFRTPRLTKRKPRLNYTRLKYLF